MNQFPGALRLPFGLLLLAAAASAQTGFPFQDETLSYNINWQSGLSLGEVTLTAHHEAGTWEFTVSGNAGVPGFAIADTYRSMTEGDFCSTLLERDIGHGGKKVREKTTFDQKKGSAHRVTLFPDGGGQSDIDIPSCARDAVAYAYYARRELGQGRVPPQQQLFFGSGYSVRMEYTGAQTITVNERPAVTDHLVVYVKGPKSDFSLEVFYARDPARTPLSIRVPTAVGIFSLELVR
jgi:hypothetical protein